MLSSSHPKIHEPLVTGVSPRPTDRRQRQKTAKHEGPHRHHLRLNFANMPELNWALGYPFALLLMALASVGLYALAKRFGWL